MSKIDSTTTTAIILSFGLAPMGSASAFALDGSSRMATPHSLYAHLAGKRVGHRLAPATPVRLPRLLHGRSFPAAASSMRPVTCRRAPA